MTVVVGIRCTDGVVIGSDSAMTFGRSPQHPTIEQFHPNKIDIVGSNIIVTGTGHIGLGQRFTHEVEKVSNSDVIKNGHVVEVGQILARAAFWKDGVPDLQEGIFAATFVLKLACDMAPVGVSPPLQMVVLRKGKEGRGGFRAFRLSKDDLAEHEESVTGP